MSTAQPIDVALYGSSARYGDLCVHAVVDLRRSLSRSDLERAVEATAASFPVLDCVYEPRFFRDRWARAKSPIADAVHVIEDGDREAATEVWTQRPLDPERERPIRVVLLPAPSGCRIIVSLSHIAADGAGMAAVGHVLGAHLYGVPPSLPVEPRRDLRRALDGLSLMHVPVLARDLLGSALQSIRLMGAGVRERPYPTEASVRPRVRQVVFEASEIEAIKARCGARVSVNDLLVAAVARVGAGRSSEGPVPVIYTMDLRRFSRSPHLSAANASTMLTTLVPRAATGDLATAAGAVRKLTAHHRQSLLGPAFLLLPLLVVGAAPHAVVRRILPGFHPLLVDMPIRRGLIFTNVGKLDDGLGPFAGDIEALRVVGPNIWGVPVPAIVAFGLRGRVHLELFAPPGLGEGALDELERELREALELPAASAAKGAPLEERL